MQCAVCNCRVSPELDATYRLGELVGVLCSECDEGLSEAVGAWAVRRTREVEAERKAIDRALNQAFESERREAERARAVVQSELFPKRVRLMGVRN